ncbi:MAG: CarD family transcriptional regulator [bacterium]|nr:CarD family transcriptional regulator [bacterium]
MFKPGDVVVHKTLGAGLILDVEEKVIDGTAIKFLRVQLKLKEGDILIPCTENGCAELRLAMTPEQVGMIEKILQTKSVHKSGLIAPSEASVTPEELVDSRDPFKIAKAIRLLIDASKSPEFPESRRELLSTARTALVGELMQVKGIRRAAAFTFITRALKAGDLAAKEKKKKLK